MQGVKVMLVHNGDNTVEQTVYTDENGAYKFEKISIEKILNGEYNVVFEYDGLVWTNVKVDKDYLNKIEGENSSKSQEKNGDRTNFNDSFSTVVGNGNGSEDERLSGHTEPANGTSSRNLAYEAVEVKDDDGNVVEAKEAKLKTVNTSVSDKTLKIGDGNGGDLGNYYPIYANINTGEHYLEQTYVYAVDKDHLNDYELTEIPNNNLGLYKREQPDIAIVKDIENVKLSINGKDNIYEYAKRYQHLNQEEAQKQEERNGQNVTAPDNNLGYDVGVKFAMKYKDMSYTRAIYESDYKYDDEDGDDGKGNELQVYVTYKLEVRNQTGPESGLITVVNNIVDYYDKGFELDTIGKGIENGEVSEIVQELNEIKGNVQGYNDEFNKMNIRVPLSIRPQESESIYVRFKLTRDMVEKKITVDDDAELNDKFINNIVEIGSYSILKENDGKTETYAGIDIDSNPGNARPGEVSTYEDDTDKCPSLRLKMAEKRQMLGTVFVDEPLQEQKNGSKPNDGEYREGNGIYEETEETLGDVVVTYRNISAGNMIYKTKSMTEDKSDVLFGLRPAVNDDIAIYGKKDDEDIGNIYIIEEVSSGVKYDYATSVESIKKGEYYLGDFIPGNYKLTFTWGDIEHEVQYFKGTIYNQERESVEKPYNVNWTDDEYTEWYKHDVDTRYTDAVDDYGARKTIDEQTQNILYNKSTKTQVDNAYNGTGDEVIKITTIDSTTPGMNVGIEYAADDDKSHWSDDFEWNGGTYLTNLTKNVDFGIVERPRQNISLMKRIKHVTATLANGQVFVDAEITESGELKGQVRYTTYLPPAGPNEYGTLKIELDDELIQGATVNLQYEISVENLSELDFTDEGFYKYGQKINMGEDVKASTAVRLIPSTVIDYLDDGWIYKEIEIGGNNDTGVTSENGWVYFVKDQEQQDYEKYLTEEVRKSDEFGQVKKIYTNYFKSNNGLVAKIYGTETGKYEQYNVFNKKSADLKVSKELSTTDEIELNNRAEIVEIDKSGGPEQPGGAPLVPETVPGNYVPGSETNEDDNDTSETTVVTSSTGENREFTSPVAVIITAMVILGTGIIIIMKKVLSNKQE